MPTSIQLNAEQKRKNVTHTKIVRVGKLNDQMKPANVTPKNTELRRKSKVVAPSTDSSVQSKTALRKRTTCTPSLLQKTGKETKTKVQSTTKATKSSTLKKQSATTPAALLDPSRVETRQSLADINKAISGQQLSKKDPSQNEDLCTATQVPVASITEQQQHHLKDQQKEDDLQYDLPNKGLVKNVKVITVAANAQSDEQPTNTIHTDHIQSPATPSKEIASTTLMSGDGDNVPLLNHSCINSNTTDSPTHIKKKTQDANNDEPTNNNVSSTVFKETGASNDYASSSIYQAEVQSVQENNNCRTSELLLSSCQQQHLSNATLYSVQPVQRSEQPVNVATALEHNNNGGCDMQQQQQQHFQQPFRRRPLSYTEAMGSIYNKSCSYSCAASPIDLASPPAEDYIAMHEPPFYCQSQPLHNNETHYAYLNHQQHQYNRQHHNRQQSDKSVTAARNYTTPSPPMSVINDVNNVNNSNNRRISAPTNNTMQNLLVYDGQTQRIVQLIGVDYNATTTPLSSVQSTMLPGMIMSTNNTKYGIDAQQQTSTDSGWAVPATEQLIYEQSRPDQKQQQLLFSALQQQDRCANKMIIPPQQQQRQEHSSTDDCSVDCNGHSNYNNTRLSVQQLQRKNSNRSLTSLRSTSPSIQSCDLRYEQLNFIIEKERATVKALQKQKEAFNKDISFLSKCLDDATAENNDLKRKLETENAEKERYREEHNNTLKKLKEAYEQIRQLENRNRSYSDEIARKTQDLENLEKRNKLLAARDKTTLDNQKQGTDRRLTVQLHQAHSQIKLLKSTMEQFLKMGVFSSDWNALSPTTSIDAIVSDLKCGRSSRRQLSTLTSSMSRSTKNIPRSPEVSSGNASNMSSNVSKLEEQSTSDRVPAQNTLDNNSADKSTHITDLHTKLQELAREKEILQSEYNKTPVTGGNKALVRRHREELETRLDKVDTELSRVKLKLRNRSTA